MRLQNLIKIFFWIFIFLYLTWGIDLLIFTYPDEGRNAYATLHMIKTGQFIVPFYNGEIRYDKPPLLYYLAILVYEVLKIFNYENIEFSFRLVSVIATFLSCMVVFELSKYFLKEEICRYFSVFIYVSMVNIFIESKAFVPEPLLTFFINFSLLAFYKVYFEYRNNDNLSYRWIYLFWISLGFAMLSKGIVGIIVTFLVITVFLMIQRDLRFLKQFFKNIFPVITGILIGFSWFIVVGIKTNGSFLYHFFFDHNIGRFTGASNMHVNPFYFYIPVILINILPISELAILFAVKLLTNLKQKIKQNSNKLLFLWVYFGIIVIFYSLSKGKVHHYILPSFTALSILIAFFIEEIRNSNDTKINKWILINFMIPLSLFFFKVPSEFENLKNSFIWLFSISSIVYYLILNFNRKLIFITTFLKVLLFYYFVISNIPSIFYNQKEFIERIKDKTLITLGDKSTVSFYNLYINNQPITFDIFYINNTKSLNSQTIELINESLKKNKQVMIFFRSKEYDLIKQVFNNYKFDIRSITVAQSNLMVIEIKNKINEN